MPLKIKLLLGDNENRRFSITDDRMRTYSLQSLHDDIKRVYGDIGAFDIYYFENGLFVEVVTNNDWERALRYAHLLGSYPLTLHLTKDIAQVRLSMFAPTDAESADCRGSAIPIVGSAQQPIEAESSLEQRLFKFMETIPVLVQDGMKDLQQLVEKVGSSVEESINEKKPVLQEGAAGIRQQVESVADQVKQSVDHLFEQKAEEATFAVSEAPRAESVDSPSCGECRRPMDGGNDVPMSLLGATFVADGTYPDGTAVTVSSTFTKVWKMKNNSACAWPRGTTLQAVGPRHFPKCLNAVVPIAQPGEEVDVSVELQAPAEAGLFTGYFRLFHPVAECGFGERMWAKVEVETDEFEYEEQLDQLLAMGFDADVCKVLLEDFDGNVDTALDYLVADP